MPSGNYAKLARVNLMSTTASYTHYTSSIKFPIPLTHNKTLIAICKEILREGVVTVPYHEWGIVYYFQDISFELRNAIL